LSLAKQGARRLSVFCEPDLHCNIANPRAEHTHSTRV